MKKKHDTSKKLNKTSIHPVTTATIGVEERLKYLRKRKNWSQDFLAEKADLSFQTVSSIERGVRKMSETTLHKLSTALDVTDSFLLYGAFTPQEYIQFLNGEIDLPFLYKDEDNNCRELDSELTKILLRNRPKILSEIIELEDPHEREKAYIDAFRLLEYFLHMRNQSSPSISDIRDILDFFH